MHGKDPAREGTCIPLHTPRKSASPPYPSLSKKVAKENKALRTGVERKKQRAKGGPWLHFGWPPINYNWRARDGHSASLTQKPSFFQEKMRLCSNDTILTLPVP